MECVSWFSAGDVPMRNCRSEYFKDADLVHAACSWDFALRIIQSALGIRTGFWGVFDSMII